MPVGNDVRVGLGNNNLNIYVGLISPYGEFFKSSSCALAMDYFPLIGKLFSPKQPDKKTPKEEPPLYKREVLKVSEGPAVQT